MTDGVLIGARLDALGLKANIGPDQQIMQVLVIIKAMEFGPDGNDELEPNLIIASDDSTDWIAVRGLLHSAREIFESERGIKVEED